MENVIFLALTRFTLCSFGAIIPTLQYWIQDWLWINGGFGLAMDSLVLMMKKYAIFLRRNRPNLSDLGGSKRIGYTTHNWILKCD